MPEGDDTLICHRCHSLVRVGRGELYRVRISAICDPQVRELEDMDADQIAGEIRRLIEQASAMSERELREQVSTELELILCAPCYRQWIENPAGA